MNRVQPIASAYVTGRSHSIVTFSGHLTGAGWLRAILRDFATEEGLTFENGKPEMLDCATDIFQASINMSGFGIAQDVLFYCVSYFQIEEYSEMGLLRLQEPFKGAYVVRDPRSIILEQWLSLSAACNKTDELGTRRQLNVIRLDHSLQQKLLVRRHPLAPYSFPAASHDFDIANADSQYATCPRMPASIT